jgi:hypothetical protein
MPLGLFNVFPSPWPYTILMKLAVFCSYFRLVYGRYAQESVNFVTKNHSLAGWPAQFYLFLLPFLMSNEIIAQFTNLPWQLTLG